MSDHKSKSKYPPYLFISVAPNGNAIISPKYVECGLYLKEYIKKDDVQGIHEMASHNISFNEDRLGFLPLTEAIEKGHINSLRALLSNGADPTVLNSQKITQNPYCYAIKKGKTDIVSEMIRYRFPNKDIVAAMLKTAILESQFDAIVYMLDRDLFRDLTRHDPALEHLRNHPVMHFPGKTRQLVRALYNKEDIDPEKFDLDSKKLEMRKAAEKAFEKSLVKRLDKKKKRTSQLKRRPKR